MRWFQAYLDWENSAIRRNDWFELNGAKFCMICLTLMITNLWPPAAGLSWYWYLLGAAFFGALPVYRAARAMPDLIRRIREA
jgi:hypothetical protein